MKTISFQSNIAPETLRQAAELVESITKQQAEINVLQAALDEKQKQLDTLLNIQAAPARTMSAEARAKISEAQQRRWAKAKAQTVEPAPEQVAEVAEVVA